MKTISTEKAKNAFKVDLSLNLTGQLLTTLDQGFQALPDRFEYTGVEMFEFAE